MYIHINNKKIDFTPEGSNRIQINQHDGNGQMRRVVISRERAVHMAEYIIWLYGSDKVDLSQYSYKQITRTDIFKMKPLYSRKSIRKYD